MSFDGPHFSGSFGFGPFGPGPGPREHHHHHPLFAESPFDGFGVDQAGPSRQHHRPGPPPFFIHGFPFGPFSGRAAGRGSGPWARGRCGPRRGGGRFGRPGPEPEHGNHNGEGPSRGPHHHHPAPGAGHPHHPPPPPPPAYMETDHPLAQLISSLTDVVFPSESEATTTARNANTGADIHAADAADSSQTTGTCSTSCNTPSTSDLGPFTPPLDLYATPNAYILHLALPGAKKEDVGVDWDADRSFLRVAGVVHRPGDEALLASLVPGSAERRVGFFERNVTLPPEGVSQPHASAAAAAATAGATVPTSAPVPASAAGDGSKRAEKQKAHEKSKQAYVEDEEMDFVTPSDADDNDDDSVTEKWSVTDAEEEIQAEGEKGDNDNYNSHDGSSGREEIDGNGITAKMEDGLLIVTVPRVEKRWNDVRKVDIQ